MLPFEACVARRSRHLQWPFCSVLDRLRGWHAPDDVHVPHLARDDYIIPDLPEEFAQ